MRRTVVSLVLCLVTLTTGARAQAAPDWSALSDETLHTLAEYVKVNTTDPPEHTSAAIAVASVAK